MSSPTRKKYNCTDNADRERIVKSYINGNNPPEIARVMGYNKRTVMDIIKKYTEGKDFYKQPRTGRPKNKVISESHLKIIQSWVDEDCKIALKTIKEKLMNEMGISAGKSTISKHMKEFNFSFKRINPITQSNDIVLQDNNLVILETRAYYANFFMNQMQRFDDSKFFFINVATFSVMMRSKFKQEEIKNKKFTSLGPGFSLKDISMYCAISRNGIVKYQNQVSFFDTESFYRFIELIIAQLAHKNITDAMIFVDNDYVDKDANIRGLIGSNGHRLICLPPNSPFLNPVESIYTKWMQLIRAEDPQNEKKLFEVMDSALVEITSNDCNSFYNTMLHFLPRCTRKEIISSQ